MEWRLIETAPKDGSYIIMLKFPSHNLVHPVVIGKWERHNWKMQNTLRVESTGFSHWMPIPEFPIQDRYHLCPNCEDTKHE